ncbi:MAG: amidohydrolase [Alphaproteobacteria bacterium]
MARILRGALILLIVVLGLAGAAGFALYQSWNPAPPAAQVFYNGPVLTMNGTNDIAEAVLVEGGQISLVGTQAEIVAAAPENAIMHDLAGKALLPGFIDAHGHYPGWGVMSVALNLSSPPVGTVQSIDEIKAMIAAKVATVSPGTWIVGMGYDDTLVAEMRHPTAADIDEVAPENPVGIIHVSGHMTVVNTRAMQEMAVTADTPDPDGGEIVRDTAGQPTGLMKETASYIFRDKLLGFGPADIATLLRAGNQDYLTKGVTTAQNGLANEAMFVPLGWLSRIGYMPIRIVSLVEAEYALALQQQGKLFDLESDKYHIAGVKIVTDGSIQGYTGFLGKPYFVPHAGHGPDYRGYPIYQKDALNDLVARSMQTGLRPYMHGNGDASIDMILDAVEQGQAVAPKMRDAWPVIIHAQMMRSDQIARAKTLSVSPSFFNAHVYYWGDRHRDIFMGPERAARMSPMNEALRAQLPFTLHLDTPIVPMDPWVMVWSAVERRTSSGQQLGPDQRIGLMQAIRGTTIDAAWQAGLGEKTGSIEQGKWADLIIVDQDPRAADDLREIKTLSTFVGGVEQFNAATQ